MTRLTIAQAAKRLNVSSQCVRQLCKARRIGEVFYHENGLRGLYIVWAEWLEQYENGNR